jgi:hypothetical protein
MGIIPVGIFLEFDCDTFGVITPPLAAGVPRELARITLSVDPNTTVWLTAFARWIPASPNLTLRLQIIREDDPNETICTAEDTSAAPANRPYSTTLTCCDENPPSGEQTYLLVATAIGGSISIQEGTLTGAVIAN